MAVVDDGVGAFTPGDVEFRQFCLHRRTDVEWRLLCAHRAHLVGPAERAPIVGASFAGIAPVRSFGGETCRRIDRAQREPRKRFQDVTAIHGVSSTAARQNYWLAQTTRAIHTTSSSVSVRSG